MRTKTKYTLISCCSLAVFFAIWEILTDVLQVAPSYVLPSPLKVLECFATKLVSTSPDGAVLGVHVWESLKVSFAAFVAAAVVGIPLGIAMAWYQTVDKLVKPIFDLLRPIPPIGWIPIMILALGIGFWAKVAVIFVGALIPCVINSYTGIKQTNQVHLWVGNTFGATRTQMLFRIAIPTALPVIFTGLKTALGIAWMTLVAAELLASTSGLGYMIQVARTIGRADIIVMGMLVIGVVGLILSGILDFLENKFVKGRKA
ncbi:MAG TPA: ABC transporter permease [Candidatus Mediterraneibacter ornithocaccae]|nr:ABC transporter permease [Candidatus Mediterraneibacter ornithocaccae]